MGDAPKASNDEHIGGGTQRQCCTANRQAQAAGHISNYYQVSSLKYQVASRHRREQMFCYLKFFSDLFLFLSKFQNGLI